VARATSVKPSRGPESRWQNREIELETGTLFSPRRTTVRTLRLAGGWLCLAVILCPGAARAEAPPRYTLAECLRVALEQNPDIQIAGKRLDETAGAIVEARAGFLPSLTTVAQYEYLQSDYAKLSGTLPNRREYIWNANARLTENLYAGGADRGRMAIARLNKDSRILDYQAAVDRVVMDTRIAFYDILRNKAEIDVHQQAIDFLEEQRKSEQEKLDVGTGQRLYVLRAEVGLALERAALIEAQNRLKSSYLALSELLAIPYSTEQRQLPLEVDGELAYEKLPLDVNDCLARARDQRPELRARSNEIQVQKKQLVVDRSAILPRVDLFAGYDVVSEPNRTQPVEYYKGYVAGVAVTWQAFDGLAARGRMRATRARMDAAELAQDATRRAIEAEVLRAYRDLKRAEETIESQRQNAALAKESLDLAKTNFELGLISQLDLLQSQLDLSRAQTVELSARFEYNAALARLERAMSGRFEPASTKP
jgi:outer membrane protein